MPGCCTSVPLIEQDWKARIFSLPKPLRRHLSDGVDIAHVASQTDQLNSDGRAFLDHVSGVIGILWWGCVRVVSHVRWKMLLYHQHKLTLAAPKGPTSLDTKTVNGPASQKTPCGLIEPTAQSICTPVLSENVHVDDAWHRFLPFLP